MLGGSLPSLLANSPRQTRPYDVLRERRKTSRHRAEQQGTRNWHLGSMGCAWKATKVTRAGTGGAISSACLLPLYLLRCVGHHLDNGALACAQNACERCSTRTCDSARAGAAAARPNAQRASGALSPSRHCRLLRPPLTSFFTCIFAIYPRIRACARSYARRLRHFLPVTHSRASYHSLPVLRYHILLPINM